MFQKTDIEYKMSFPLANKLKTEGHIAFVRVIVQKIGELQNQCPLK